MTTRAQIVPFGEWLPDLPQYANKGALIALNVIPQLESYRQLNDLSSFTNALANVCLGSFWAQDANNLVYNFAGDTNSLYELDAGTTWQDVSGTSAPYAADNWEFTKFGQRVIAANKNDPLQKWDLGTDTTFSDLAGSPPQAARIATIRDFVMLGDIDSLGPNYVQWSGYNNTETWTPSLATQSDFQELFGRGGRVQRIVPGDYGVIFLEQSIFTAEYAGLPTIFQFDEVKTKRGTPAPNSVVWTGDDIYYYGWDNFYLMRGNQTQPISANRVSNWFRQNASDTGLESMRGAVDRRNRLIIWAFRSSVSATINDRLIIYNWAADKWSYAEVETELIDEYVAPGFTLDELDTPLPGGIDTDSIPVDSDQFLGGNIAIQAFNSDSEACTFDGAPLAATIDTKEISGPGHQRLYCNGVRPLIEGTAGTATITVQVGTRNRLTENVQFSTARNLNSINGEANFRVNSRYQRYRINIADGFIHGNGVKANIRQKGGRR